MEGDQMAHVTQLLGQAKAEMIRLSGHFAGTSQQWDRAQSLLQWAQQVDGIISGITRTGPLPTPRATPALTTHTSTPRPPYYYIYQGKLVKVGPSRDGGTYEHRVLQEHWNLVLSQLAQMARTSRTFETPDLVNRCDIPKHEPLIVLAVLEEHRLLQNTRRGRWSFANATTFAEAAARVWSSIPVQ